MSEVIQIKPKNNMNNLGWFYKKSPDQIVLKEHISMEFKAIISFKKAKMKLLILTYNWRINFPTHTDLHIASRHNCLLVISLNCSRYDWSLWLLC